MRETFDCVAFQRKVREELSKEFMADPEAYFKRLKEKQGHYCNKGKDEEVVEAI